MNEQKIALTDLEAFELLAFLITSAYSWFNDPYNYGTYRLISAAEKLAQTWRPKCSDETARFLDDLLARMARDIERFENDVPAYQAFLAKSCQLLALEIKRRGQEEGATDGT